MSNAVLKTDLEGKIRNLHHFKSEALLPIFEAIVNSIQAIEEFVPKEVVLCNIGGPDLSQFSE